MSTTLTQLIRAGELDGYAPRYPGGTAAIDREVAEESVCGACGHAGMTYRPFIRPATATRRRSYRAFAVCGACQNCEEF